MRLGVMLYEMLTGKVPFSGPNAFVIMNDRLLNNPVPPREFDPSDHAAVAGNHLPRDGARSEKRYASAREFAWDLEHPDQVGPSERPELTDWKKKRTPWLRTVLFYVVLALIPVAIFGLLLWVAKH